MTKGHIFKKSSLQLFLLVLAHIQRGLPVPGAASPFLKQLSFLISASLPRPRTARKPGAALGPELGVIQSSAAAPSYQSTNKHRAALSGESCKNELGLWRLCPRHKRQSHAQRFFLQSENYPQGIISAYSTSCINQCSTSLYQPHTHTRKHAHSSCLWYDSFSPCPWYTV